MKKIILFTLLFAGIVSSNAQWFGYNPYNPYSTGAMIGNAIGQGIVNNKINSRNKLRKAINKWESCQNGTLTTKQGAVAIYENYGYMATATSPEDVKDKLREINKKHSVINDINITEGGYYVIVYDGGNMWWGRMPSEVVSKLKSLPSYESLKSVSFNDNGTYIIVSDRSVYSNSSDYMDFAEEKQEELGELFSANIYGNGAVFCFEKGVDFCGTIPENVSKVMNKQSFTPRFVKFNNRGDYLICSKRGSYSYNIQDVDESSVVATVTKKPGPRRVKSTLVDEFYFGFYNQMTNTGVDLLHMFETPNIDKGSIGEYAIEFDLKSKPGHIMVKYQIINRMDNSVTDKTLYDIVPEESKFYENTKEKQINIFFRHQNGYKGILINKNNKFVAITDEMSSMSASSLRDYKCYYPLSFWDGKLDALGDFGKIIAAYIGAVKGFNKNQNFNHGIAHTDNENFGQRYEKLLSELSRYPWRK